MSKTIDWIIRYENGELDDVEVLRMFAELIKSGTVWQLQGSYGRTAHRIIEAGYISTKGEILVEHFLQGDA